MDIFLIEHFLGGGSTAYQFYAVLSKNNHQVYVCKNNYILYNQYIIQPAMSQQPSNSDKNNLNPLPINYQPIDEDTSTFTIKSQPLTDTSQPTSSIHPPRNQVQSIENYDSFLLERTLQIEKPQVIKEGYLLSYKLYTIKSRKRNSEYYDTIVHRRFNDFQFLHYELIENYGGCVLPKLPEKNILAKFDIEEKQFQQVRVKLLENYLMILLNHRRFKNFLFLDDIKFSFRKGKFAEESALSHQLNDIKSSLIGVSKLIYQKIVGSKQRNLSFSREVEEEGQLRLFEREIQDLLRIITEIKPIVEESYEQFRIITDIGLSINEEKPGHSDKKEKEYHDRFKNIINEFQEVTAFVSNCYDAIQRTKVLRGEIEDLEEGLKEMEMKQRNNPRMIELDIMRGQIQKKNAKCEKWLSFLKKELEIYTNEGKTLMQHFVRKFNILKGQVYAFFSDKP